MNVMKSELPAGQALRLGDQVGYLPGSIVSRTIARSASGSITLFAFDAGQELSEHTSAYDAFVQVLDGTVELVIGGARVVVEPGQAVVMPAGVPHAVRGPGPFKMLLSMVRG